MSEIEAIEQAHRSAQAKLGLAISIMATEQWQSVAPTSPGATGAIWASAVAEGVALAQELSLQLARAYYNAARAVEIGILLGDPIDDDAPNMGNARDSFIRRLLAVDALGTPDSELPLGELIPPNENFALMDLSGDLQDYLDAIEESRDNEQLQVDPFDWFAPEDHDERAGKIARSLFEDSVSAHMDELRQIRRRSREDERKGAADRTARRTEKSWISHGKRGASGADTSVMQYGRNVLDRASGSDKRVLMFARGTAANPCHFCAMLASRGFVYASSQTASRSYRNGGLRSYHPNCHCFPIARWVKDSPLPERNTWFQELWNEEIAGNYSGKEAINEWRQLLNSRRDEAGRLPYQASPRRTA